MATLPREGRMDPWRWLRPPVWLHVLASGVGAPLGLCLGLAAFLGLLGLTAPHVPRDPAVHVRVGVVLLTLLLFGGLPLGGVVGLAALTRRLPARCPRCGGGARAERSEPRALVVGSYACRACGHRHAWNDLSPWPLVRLLANALLIPLQVALGLLVAGMILGLAFFLAVALLAHLHLVVGALLAAWVVVAPLILRRARRRSAPVPWGLVLFPLLLAGILAPGRMAIVLPGELGVEWEGLRGTDSRTGREGEPLVVVAPAPPLGLRWAVDLVICLSGGGLALWVGRFVWRRAAIRVPRVRVGALARGVFEVEGVAQEAGTPRPEPLLAVTRTVRLAGTASQVSTELALRPLLLGDATGRVLIDPRGATPPPPVGLELLWPRAKLLLRRRWRFGWSSRGTGWRVERTLQAGDRVRLIAWFEPGAEGAQWTAGAGGEPSARSKFDPHVGPPPFVLGDGARLGLRLALRGPLIRAAPLVLVWVALCGGTAALLLSRLSYRGWLPEQLADHAPPERRSELLLEALLRAGEEVPPALVQALRACTLTPHDRAWEGRLQRLAAHPQEEVRAFAVQGLAHLVSPPAGPDSVGSHTLFAFRRALTDVAAPVRAAAQEALSGLGPAGLRTAEQAVRTAGLPEGRAAAVAVISRLMPGEARLRRLVELLGDRQAAVRRAAAEQLARSSPGPRETAALLAALGDPVAEVREAAFLALPAAAADELPLAALGPFAAASGDEARAQAWAALGRRPAELVEPLALAELVSGYQPRVGAALRWLESLRPFPSPAAAEPLGQLVAAGEGPLLYDGLRLLQRMERGAAGAVPHLIRLLERGVQRELILEVLDGVGPLAGAAAPALEEHLRRSPRDARTFATLARVRVPRRESGWEARLEVPALLGFDGVAFHASGGAPLPSGAAGPFSRSTGARGPALPLSTASPVRLSWDPPLPLGRDFALEAWVRPASGATLALLRSNLVDLEIRNGAPLVQCRWGRLSSGFRLVQGQPLADDWHHLALVRDGEGRSVEVYLDGAWACSLPDFLVGDAPEGAGLALTELEETLSWLELGGAAGAGSDASGALLESLRLYDHLRTPEQVAKAARFEVLPERER